MDTSIFLIILVILVLIFKQTKERNKDYREFLQKNVFVHNPVKGKSNDKSQRNMYPVYATLLDKALVDEKVDPVNAVKEGGPYKALQSNR